MQARARRRVSGFRKRKVGAIDFWSVDVTGRAARGRKYHLVLVEESARDEGYLKGTLEAVIMPAALDLYGDVAVKG